jgi:hypothetical protein
MPEIVHANITTKDIAKLIKRCAFELTVMPSSTDRDTCIETARGMNMTSFGELIYLLLSTDQDRTLEWADKEGRR